MAKHGLLIGIWKSVVKGNIDIYELRVRAVGWVPSRSATGGETRNPTCRGKEMAISETIWIAMSSPIPSVARKARFGWGTKQTSYKSTPKIIFSIRKDFESATRGRRPQGDVSDKSESNTLRNIKFLVIAFGNRRTRHRRVPIRPGGTSAPRARHTVDMLPQKGESLSGKYLIYWVELKNGYGGSI